MNFWGDFWDQGSSAFFLSLPWVVLRDSTPPLVRPWQLGGGHISLLSISKYILFLFVCDTPPFLFGTSLYLPLSSSSLRTSCISKITVQEDNEEETVLGCTTVCALCTHYLGAEGQGVGLDLS